METLHIQVSTELMKRLEPHQKNLVTLLELGLRYLETHEAEATALDIAAFEDSQAYVQQKEVETMLREQGGLIGPDLDTRLQYALNKTEEDWQPVSMPGQMLSELIIQQRQGILKDE